MQEKDVMEAALQAGHLLLENGAEISRVEETIQRISRCFGIHTVNTFVLANGIFVSLGDEREAVYTKVDYIPVKGAHLDRIAAVNQLSREIEEGRYTLEEVFDRLQAIREMPGKPRLMQVLAAGFASAAFCCLFGGDWRDCALALAAGLVLYIYVLFVSAPHLSKIIGNITGAALVTVLCILGSSLGPGQNQNAMIIGSIMPLIPGVPFTNAIRDIADGDYISGAVRMLDALLSFFCIALGVALGFTLAGKGGGLA